MLVRQFVLEYRDILKDRKGQTWRPFSSASWFETEAQARQFMRSAEVACVRDGLSFVFRVTEGPLREVKRPH